jgi:flagellin FlaB
MMKLFKKNETASIGIGAMIVFIAMVLVAGIAASVLIQTSTTLESQAMATGTQTTQEVAGGIAVYCIEGKVMSGGDIDGLAITVRPRAGSPNIDLNQTVILLSDGTRKVVLTYDYADTTHFNLTVGANDGNIFGVKYSDLTNEEFGILVLNDPDSSLSSRTSAVMNRGDKVNLMINATACFGTPGLSERTDIFGYIYPEHGSSGVIAFRTPASYSDTIYTLQ